MPSNERGTDRDPADSQVPSEFSNEFGWWMLGYLVVAIAALQLLPAIGLDHEDRLRRIAHAVVIADAIVAPLLTIRVGIHLVACRLRAGYSGRQRHNGGDGAGAP